MVQVTQPSPEVRLAWLGLALLMMPACRSEQPPKQEARPLVVVSIMPQAYFVERVAGNLVNIEILVGPGQSPHTYDPTPKQIARLADAKVFFRIGTAFEDAVIEQAVAANPHLLIVDTRRGIRLRRIQEGEAEEEAGHGERAGHDEQPQHGRHQLHDEDQPGGLDPHIWLAPLLVKTQAQTICEVLCRMDSAHESTYRQNLRSFHRDLDNTDAQLKAALAPLKGREFFVYHPAFGYFADAYGLKQIAVETGGREPSAKHLAGLIAKARRAGVRLIFLQPQFGPAGAKALAAEIGGAVVPMDDLARDYLTNLKDMASKIQQALASSTKPAGGP